MDPSYKKLIAIFVFHFLSFIALLFTFPNNTEASTNFNQKQDENESYYLCNLQGFDVLMNWQ